MVEHSTCNAVMWVQFLPAAPEITEYWCNGNMYDCRSYARGSIPLYSAIYRNVAQSGRAHGLGPWGRRFEPSHSDHEGNYLDVGATVAYSAWNRDNVGSNPTIQTRNLKGSVEKSYFDLENEIITLFNFFSL